MKIAVLSGGNSTEREVSLISGKGVYGALKELGHKVVLLDVYLGRDDVNPKTCFDEDIDWTKGIGGIGEDSPSLEAIKALKNGERNFFGPNVLEICAEADIAFMALHGANGEDGRIQAAFDLLGIKYTGTDYLSSAICMDKGITKELLLADKVPTPLGFSFEKGEEYEDRLEGLKYPLVVKASCGGSSVGVYFANSKEEVKPYVEKALTYGDKVVIEEFVKGREFTCGIIDGEALPIVEILPREGKYDYKNKYQSGGATEVCPAQIDDELRDRIQAVTRDVYKALKIRTYARVDIIVDENNDIYCLEANTLPGMTPTSLLPQEAREIGLNYGQLCEKIIQISLEKY